MNEYLVTIWFRKKVDGGVWREWEFHQVHAHQDISLHNVLLHAQRNCGSIKEGGYYYEYRVQDVKKI